MVRRTLFLLAALLVLGCSAREPLPEKGKVIFSFALECGEFTKTVDENLIGDLNLYLFNSGGDVIFWNYLSGGGEASADIWGGESCSVYVVANAGMPLMVKDAGELENLSVAVPGETESILMSGKLESVVLEDGDRVTVPLTRAMSKIVLKADYGGLDSDVSIEVKSISLKNVPLKVRLFGTSAFGQAELFSSGESVYNPSLDDMRNGVAFYQYENMQGTLLPGNTDQQKKVWPVESNWAKVCSYVEMEATYASDTWEGDILYRFYLGSDMVANYDVERNKQYVITVSFKGDGGADENSWRVDNSGLEDVVPPEIAFGKSEVPMYDLQVEILPFSKLDARGGKVSVESSDPSVLQVLEWNDECVKVKALAPGDATVVASVKGVSASCSVKVEKLRLVPRSASITLFNHFYDDIEYDIYPHHAADLGIKLTASAVSAASLVTGFGGDANRLMPQYGRETPFPVSEKVRISIDGREDVYEEVTVNVYPMISVAQEIIMNANMGNSVQEKSLELKTHPRAEVEFEWLPSDGQTIYGTPPPSVSCNRENITINVPTDANGRYRLCVSVTGDDGYGAAAGAAADPVAVAGVSAPQDAVAYCDLVVYETVYLVGISKSMNREKIDVSPDIWRYENEVVAKWLAHPQSLLFPEGEVGITTPFLYKGELFTDNHTQLYENYEFTFYNGERYDYSLGEDSFVYNGAAPQSYYEYFFLQPVNSPYIDGSLPHKKPFYYVCSRNFAGGFTKSGMPNWKSVFEYIYPPKE